MRGHKEAARGIGRDDARALQRRSEQIGKGASRKTPFIEIIIDDPQIMDKLLDKEMHQLYRAPPVGAYSQPASKPSSSQQQQGFYMWASSANGTPQGSTASLVVVPPPVDLSMTPNQAVHRKTPSSGCESDDSASVRGGDTPCSSTSTLIGQSGTLSLLQDPAVLQHATG